MKINKISTAALMVLVLIVLNILFFLWTDSGCRGIVEWMSYGFTTFAFVVACNSIFRIRQDSDETYHLATTYLPMSYFVFQTVLSVVALYISAILRKTKYVSQLVNDSLTDLSVNTVQNGTAQVADISPSFFANHFAEIVISVYLLVLVFYVISISIHATANKSTEGALAEQKEKRLFIEESCHQLQRLLVVIKEPNARKCVNSLYESIRYKACRTTPDGMIIQDEITEGIQKLKSYVMESNWVAVQTLSQELIIKANLI